MVAARLNSSLLRAVASFRATALPVNSRDHRSGGIVSTGQRTSDPCFQIILFLFDWNAALKSSGVVGQETSETHFIASLLKHTHAGRDLIDPILPDTLLKNLKINATSG